MIVQLTKQRELTFLAANRRRSEKKTRRTGSITFRQAKGARFDRNGPPYKPHVSAMKPSVIVVIGTPVPPSQHLLCTHSVPGARLETHALRGHVRFLIVRIDYASWKKFPGCIHRALVIDGVSARPNAQPNRHFLEMAAHAAWPQDLEIDGTTDGQRSNPCWD